MERNADITVKSREASYTVRGVLTRTGDGVRIAYDEPPTLQMGGVATVLTVSGGVAELTRTGAVRCAFRFEEGKPHSSVYETPHGSFPAEIETRSLRMKLEAHGALIDLRYTLTIGGAPDEHRLKLLVREREEET